MSNYVTMQQLNSFLPLRIFLIVTNCLTEKYFERLTLGESWTSGAQWSGTKGAEEEYW